MFSWCWYSIHNSYCTKGCLWEKRKKKTVLRKIHQVKDPRNYNFSAFFLHHIKVRNSPTSSHLPHQLRLLLPPLRSPHPLLPLTCPTLPFCLTLKPPWTLSPRATCASRSLPLITMRTSCRSRCSGNCPTMVSWCERCTYEHSSKK